MGDATNYLAAGIREAIERIETALKSGVSLSNEFLLKGELLNKQGQLAEASQQEVHFEKEKKEEKARETSSVSYLVEQEQKLNAAEKQQYSEFLQLDHFRRQDFEKLDSFYESSWNKLSDEGKAQMSHRVWEGVRQGEYSFSDLPDTVKKKESEWLYLQMTGQKDAAPWVNKIPEKDREDFKRAYEAKDQKAVEEVLNRESISQRNSGKSVSKETDSTKENQAGDKPKTVEKEDKRSVEQPLAFGESPAAVNPLSGLSAVNGGSGRSI